MSAHFISQRFLLCKPVFLISTEEKGQKYGAQSPLELLHFGKFTFWSVLQYILRGYDITDSNYCKWQRNIYSGHLQLNFSRQRGLKYMVRLCCSTAADSEDHFRWRHYAHSSTAFSLAFFSGKVPGFTYSSLCEFKPAVYFSSKITVYIRGCLASK